MIFSVNSAGAPSVSSAKKIETLPAKQRAATAQSPASAPSEVFWDYLTAGLAGVLFPGLVVVSFLTDCAYRTGMDDPQGRETRKPSEEAGAPALGPTPDSSIPPDLKAAADLVPADKCHPADGILTNNFLDPRLVAAIRRELGKGDTDQLTTDDVLNTTKLDITNTGVTRLEGLECFENLEVLEASFNNLSDFSPLAGAKQLRQLDLNACNLNDNELSSLPFLPLLDTLWLVQNQLTDLSPLAKYPTLYLLGVNFTSAADFSPLANLPDLAIVYANHLPLSDLSPFRSLAKATYLDFRNDPIDDIQPLIDNPNVGQGTEVHLEGITAIPPGQITALKSKGANVFCQ